MLEGARQGVSVWGIRIFIANWRYSCSLLKKVHFQRTPSNFFTWKEALGQVSLEPVSLSHKKLDLRNKFHVVSGQQFGILWLLYARRLHNRNNSLLAIPACAFKAVGASMVLSVVGLDAQGSRGTFPEPDFLIRRIHSSLRKWRKTSFHIGKNYEIVCVCMHTYAAMIKVQEPC